MIMIWSFFGGGKNDVICASSQTFGIPESLHQYNDQNSSNFSQSCFFSCEPIFFLMKSLCEKVLFYQNLHKKWLSELWSHYSLWKCRCQPPTSINDSDAQNFEHLQCTSPKDAFEFDITFWFVYYELSGVFIV